jgi:hypothetical protein
LAGENPAMIKLTDKEPIYLELYESLAHFVARQQLVVRTVIELGISPESLSRGVAAWHDKTSQTGRWGSDWGFFFHGGGCELRHRLTGERIDWNGPDSLAFGTMAFIQHLEWRLKHGDDLPHLRKFVQQNDLISVITLIDALVEAGIISADRHVFPDTSTQQKNAA